MKDFFPPQPVNRAPGFMGGGFAMGTDTVPAMLTPGEFVMSRGAVSMFGADTMMAMNKMGGGTNRPKYGKVLGFSGGGLFGEAPLTKFSARAADMKIKNLLHSLLKWRMKLVTSNLKES